MAGGSQGTKPAEQKEDIRTPNGKHQHEDIDALNDGDSFLDGDGASRKKSSRICLMESKKKEEDERRAKEEQEAQKKAEEKRIARQKRKQERMQLQADEGHRVFIDAAGNEQLVPIQAAQAYGHVGMVPVDGRMLMQGQMMHGQAHGLPPGMMPTVIMPGISDQRSPTGHPMPTMQGVPVLGAAYQQPAATAAAAQVPSPRGERTNHGWTPLGKKIPTKCLKGRSGGRRACKATRLRRLSAVTSNWLADADAGGSSGVAYSAQVLDSQRAERANQVRAELMSRQQDSIQQLQKLVATGQITEQLAFGKMSEVKQLSETTVNLAAMHPSLALSELISMAQANILRQQQQQAAQMHPQMQRIPHAAVPQPLQNHPMYAMLSAQQQQQLQTLSTQQKQQVLQNLARQHQQGQHLQPQLNLQQHMQQQLMLQQAARMQQQHPQQQQQQHLQMQQQQQRAMMGQARQANTSEALMQQIGAMEDPLMTMLH